MPGSVQSIQRAAAILHLLAASAGRLSLAEVSSSLGLAKGTAHGLLRTLREVGLVEQDRASAQYRLGPALLQLGTSYLDVNELRARSLNWADSLAAHVAETVRLGSLLKNQVLVVHHVFRPDDSPQVLDVGTLLPAHATALGKALLAYAPTAARALPQIERYTRRTVVSMARLRQELTQVRRAGVAVENEEWLVGMAGIAAPIRGSGGLVVGSIGLSGPVERLCLTSGAPRPALAAAVTDAAAAIARELEPDRR
jgi:DNA-binding IclR family transcriptional regulator